MDSYIFHISLYDVLFFAMIIVGLTFALLLVFVKTVNLDANRFLALALVTIVLWMSKILVVDIQLERYISAWDRMPMQFLLALGPLLYFYVRKITRPARRFSWKDMLHFSPVLAELAVTYTSHTPQRFNPLSQVLVFISAMTYLYLSSRLIEAFYSRLPTVMMDRSRLEFRWLRRLLAATALLWLFWFGCAVAGYAGYRYRSGLHYYYPFYTLFAILIIWTAVAAFLRPQAAARGQITASPKAPVPAELRAKGAWLKRAMETNRYYEDPELSLGALAEKLGLPLHELSKTINTVFKKSFNDFVNEYRVRDMVVKLKDPAYSRMTLLGIAYEAGFNSKATFNRSFKQVMGKSAADFKNNLGKQGSSYDLTRPPQSAAVVLFREATTKRPFEKLIRNFMFRNYLRTALRGIWKQRLFTLINITGLFIGISASLVIYVIVRHDLTFDKFHRDGDRIYRVVTNYTYSGEQGYNRGVCGPIIAAAPGRVTGLEVMAPIFSLSQPNVSIPDGNAAPAVFKLQDNVILAGEGYFNLFEYQWLAGDAKTALAGPGQVVLTSQQAEKYFPGIAYDRVMGRVVLYDTIQTRVTGVVKTIAQNTDFVFHDFISWQTALANQNLKAGLRLQNWGGTSVDEQLYIKLSPNTAAASIQRQLNSILQNNYKPRPGTSQQFALQPLADIHFNTDYGTFTGRRVADRTTLYELQGLALFLLLLACINFINLTTAQSGQRAKEIGIRKTLGSSRKQLIFQFLTETFLVVLSAVILAAATAPLILNVFSPFIPAGISADLFTQPGIAVFLLLLSFTVTLLSGFYPAVVLSGYRPVSVLKKQVQAGSRHSRNTWLRKSLTVTQFVIAQFFIMATALVSKQIYYALHKDLGFKKDAIVIVDSPLKNRRPERNRQLSNMLRTIPQIEMVSQGYDAPISDWPQSTEGKFISGKKVIKFDNLAMKFGDENYIKLYHIQLLAGRNLRPGDTAANVFLINNTLAKKIGFNNPQEAVGKLIDDFDGDKRMQIIGVVADFHQESFHSPVAPLVLFTSRHNGFNGTFHVALKPQTPGGDEWKRALAAMDKAWKEVYPEDGFEYHFFDDNIATLYADEQNTAALLNWATGLSVLISCLGLLGLAIYTTHQRTKEIGVRKVLGASVTQIVVLLSTEMIWLIALAFLIVSPIAWWAMHNWMQGFADRTSISWWIFVLSGVCMLLVAMMTAGFQTVSAALANPVKSLRSE